MVNLSSDNSFDATSTDASGTEITRVTLAADNTYNMEISIVARRRSDGASATWTKFGCIKRTGGGATIVGSILDLASSQKDTALLLTSATVTTDGNDLVFTGYGLASTTIDWVAFNSTVGFKH